jgi:hypothetical protein
LAFALCFRSTGSVTNGPVDLTWTTDWAFFVIPDWGLLWRGRLIGTLNRHLIFQQDPLKNNSLDRWQPCEIKTFNGELDLTNNMNYHLKSIRYSGPKTSSAKAISEFLL